jgi:transcription-repair coupling factor (superfamily II helicase)
MDFTDLGAGFKIALHDLQIRGAGNLLGAAQSGQIAAVGYDMYVQLMENTIKEIKGEPIEDEIEPEIVLGMPAYIPESYVPDTEQRLEHYRRLSSVRLPEEIEDMAVELIDRYGQPPMEVENLLLVMELKYWLKKARVKKMEMGQSGLTLNFTEAGPKNVEKVLDIVKSRPKEAALSPEGRLFLSKKGLTGPKDIQSVKNLLQGLI